MKTFVLIPCAATKQPGRHQAKDLYVSDLFKKARAYAEQKADQYFILSAKHGLLEPDDELNAYEKTLNKMSRAARSAWSSEVFADLRLIIGAGDHVIILAGEKYREQLPDRLKKLGATVEIPLQGLGIGKQLQWLKKKIA